MQYTPIALHHACTRYRQSSPAVEYWCTSRERACTGLGAYLEAVRGTFFTISTLTCYPPRRIHQASPDIRLFITPHPTRSIDRFSLERTMFLNTASPENRQAIAGYVDAQTQGNAIDSQMGPMCLEDKGVRPLHTDRHSVRLPSACPQAESQDMCTALEITSARPTETYQKN